MLTYFKELTDEDLVSHTEKLFVGVVLATVVSIILFCSLVVPIKVGSYFLEVLEFNSFKAIEGFLYLDGVLRFLVSWAIGFGFVLGVIIGIIASVFLFFILIHLLIKMYRFIYKYRNNIQSFVMKIGGVFLRMCKGGVLYIIRFIFYIKNKNNKM